MLYAKWQMREISFDGWFCSHDEQDEFKNDLKAPLGSLTETWSQGTTKISNLKLISDHFQDHYLDDNDLVDQNLIQYYLAKMTLAHH